MPRVRAIAASASLALTASALVATAPPASADSDSARTTGAFNYRCKVKAGGFFINPAKVRITVSANVPKKVAAGSKIGKRRVRVTLRMPEIIRDNAVNVLHARKSSGRAPGAVVHAKVGKTRERVPIRRLRAKRARIPRKPRAAWNLRARGTIAAIKVPKKASGKVKVFVPKRLRVRATLYRRNGSKIKGSLRCKAPKQRKFATVKITD